MRPPTSKWTSSQSLLPGKYIQNGASYDLSAFLKDMTKRFVEACTSAEIDHFLDYLAADKRRDSA